MGNKSTHGLEHWIKKTLKECDSVEDGWKENAVHDLRVALRRCRSLADGMKDVDPSRDWRDLKRQSKRLFHALGALRDMQVLSDWVRKLAPEGDPIRERLLLQLATQTGQHLQESKEALENFDRKKWRSLGSQLAERARRIRPDGLVGQHLALERWTEAKDKDQRARKSRSAVGWHRTRIALKRLRYTAENFLPARYEGWESGLKHVQDLLGEVHDFDALRAQMRRIRRHLAAADWSRWQERIKAEQKQRIDEYRSMTSGEKSLFNVWRSELPQGAKQERASIARFGVWAAFLDPNPSHTKHVATLSLQLFDQMAQGDADAVFREERARRILHVAALLQDVGKGKKDKGHHKKSFELIRKMNPPLGWTPQDMREVALVARYHRGAEPRDRHRSFAAMTPAQQQRIMWLAALLRLANGLATERDGQVSRIQLAATPEALLVQARGYVNDLFSASRLAEQKHLLEAVAGRPVVIRGEKMDLTTAALPWGGARVISMAAINRLAS